MTDEASLREWLPKLVGVERAVLIGLGQTSNGDGPGDAVRAIPEEAHEQALTRDEVTAAVHYIRFELDAGQIDRLASGPARLAVDHAEYRHATVLTDETRRELLSDLRD